MWKGTIETGTMKEISGNMFSLVYLKFADAICVTTNGFVKKNGRAVMGAGVALQARKIFKGLDLDLGRLIKKNGNIVQIIRSETIYNKRLPVVSFPVKHNWWEKADLELIRKSLEQLQVLTDFNQWSKVILPRPGCMNGKLSWLREVKPLLESVIDDRIYIIDRSMS